MEESKYRWSIDPLIRLAVFCLSVFFSWIHHPKSANAQLWRRDKGGFCYLWPAYSAAEPSAGVTFLREENGNAACKNEDADVIFRELPQKSVEQIEFFCRFWYLILYVLNTFETAETYRDVQYAKMNMRNLRPERRKACGMSETALRIRFFERRRLRHGKQAASFFWLDVQPDPESCLHSFETSPLRAVQKQKANQP